MKMSDEEDVYICDECDDIFLSKSGLDTHVKEAHEVQDVAQKTEAVAAVKRSRSPSKEGGEQEVKKKKVKMGPASRVKRDRESSEEAEGPSINNDLVSKLLDNLASTESEGDKAKDKEKEREKHHKHKKHKDRERDRERDRHKESHREKSKKPKDRDRDRDHDRNKERDREREREKKRLKDAMRANKDSGVKRALDDSSDDEERNRRRAEKAKADWKKKDDILKGKDAKYKSNGLQGFIDDDDPNANKSKKIRERPEKSSAVAGGGFASQGTVKTHDNETGPECFKCGQICKDNSNLKNHVLSHYYQVFYQVLPDSKPFPCPECESTSRDRITLVRHYAFTHKKLFEMTDVTPEHIAGFGNRKSIVKKKDSVPISLAAKRSQNGDKVRKIDYSKIIEDDSEEEDVEDKIKRMKSKYLKVADGETRNDEGSEGDGRKEHKKHKKHKHKDHKHKKDKKHKHKDRDRDRDRDREERDGAPRVNQGGPLGSLLKDLSPDSSASSRSQSQARPEGERPETPSDQAVNKNNGNPPTEDPAEDSDDLLDDDFATPVFA